MLPMTNLITLKKSRVFPLGCLLTFQIMLTGHSAANAPWRQWQVVSQNNAGVCHCCWGEEQDFGRGEQLKNLPIRCSLRGWTRSVFVWKWQTLRLNSPVSTALLPSIVESKSAGSLSPSNKNSGGCQQRRIVPGQCRILLLFTGELDRNAISAQQTGRHELLRLRRAQRTHCRRAEQDFSSSPHYFHLSVGHSGN